MRLLTLGCVSGCIIQRTFEPLMMIHGGGEDSIPYFYHNDPNGCPGRLFNNTGDLVWAAQYNIWGSVEWMVSDQVDNPIRLQGTIRR